MCENQIKQYSTNRFVKWERAQKFVVITKQHDGNILRGNVLRQTFWIYQQQLKRNEMELIFKISFIYFMGINWSINNSQNSEEKTFCAFSPMKSSARSVNVLSAARPKPTKAPRTECTQSLWLWSALNELICLNLQIEHK